MVGKKTRMRPALQILIVLCLGTFIVISFNSFYYTWFATPKMYPKSVPELLEILNKTSELKPEASTHPTEITTVPTTTHKPKIKSTTSKKYPRIIIEPTTTSMRPFRSLSTSMSLHANSQAPDDIALTKKKDSLSPLISIVEGTFLFRALMNDLFQHITACFHAYITQMVFSK